MARQAKASSSKREHTLFFLYISPWLAGFIFLTIGPMLYSLALTLTDSKIGSIGNFVGLANYITAFTGDKLLLKAITNTFSYVLMFVPLSLLFCFFIALALNQGLRGKAVFRVVFYIPYITSGVAVTLLWGWLLSPSFGLVNYFLSTIGIPGPEWLSSTEWAMPSIVLMNLWIQGNTIIIFLAGIQDIPKQLYESAQLDGAGWWARLKNVTLPLMTPTIFFNLLLQLIGAFQMFMQTFVLTNGSGGPKDATYVFMLHIYNNGFRYGNMAYACTLAWILLVMILTVTLVIFRTSGRWVFYSDES